LKNWKTSLLGIAAGLPMLLHGAGVSLGHVGNGDWITFVQGLFVAALGLAAKDHDVTGGTTPQ
jgi:hypothetical protein